MDGKRELGKSMLAVGFDDDDGLLSISTLVKLCNQKYEYVSKKSKVGDHSQG